MTSDGEQVSRSKRASDDGDDDLEQNDSKRARTDDFSAEVRILLASRNAGAVIGKGGDVIKRLRQEYHCVISLPDSQGPERILIISGKVSNICAVLKEIIPNLEKERGAVDDEIRMLIHQNVAGRVIGKQGVKVKELRESSGAQIKVYTECCPESTERVVQMTGKAGEIATCTRMILEVLADTSQRGVNMPYNPEFADESYAHVYGGYVGGGTRRGGGRGGGGRSFGGGAGGRGRGGSGRSNFNRMGDDDMYGPPGGGFGGGFGQMGSNFGRGMRGGMGDGGRSTSHVSIPKSVAGAILGRGGMRLRQIQSESQTTIKMEQADVEGNERVITISGTSDQIQYAQYLLQQAVKQHGTPSRF